MNSETTSPIELSGPPWASSDYSGRSVRNRGDPVRGRRAERRRGMLEQNVDQPKGELTRGKTYRSREFTFTADAPVNHAG